MLVLNPTPPSVYAFRDGDEEALRDALFRRSRSTRVS
jgi:hypothetical protein